MKKTYLYVVAALWAAILGVWFADRHDEERVLPNHRGTAQISAPVSVLSSKETPRKIDISSTAQRAAQRQEKVTLASPSHLSATELTGFRAYSYPNGQPYSPGEPVTAYVHVPSTGQRTSMTPSQGGEYPRLSTKQGEEVRVRLAFSKTPPGATVAFVAQDGGKLEGKERTVAMTLDNNRQVAVNYTVSPNPGLHRVTIESPLGETKTLEFWAGPPLPIKKLK